MTKLTNILLQHIWSLSNNLKSKRGIENSNFDNIPLNFHSVSLLNGLKINTLFDFSQVADLFWTKEKKNIYKFM